MAVCVYATVFQFSYTAVFGAYTAFIFLRTGVLRRDNFVFSSYLKECNTPVLLLMLIIYSAGH